MSKLKIDVATMRNASSSLENILTELRQLKKKIEQIIQELDSTWDGAASAEFISKLSGQLEDLNATIETLSGIEKYADNTTTVMETIDKVISGLLNGIRPV